MLIRKIARLSRISLTVLALTGLAVLTVVALFGERVLRTEVERRLAEALHRRVTVGALSVNLPGRVVELRDLVIPGLPGSKQPSFTAPRVRIALSFRSLFTRRILLRGLELEKPTPIGYEFAAGNVTIGVWEPEAVGMEFLAQSRAARAARSRRRGRPRRAGRERCPVSRRDAGLGRLPHGLLRGS